MAAFSKAINMTGEDVVDKLLTKIKWEENKKERSRMNQYEESEMKRQEK